ncbi:hypothetical protein AGMMS50268_16990 [Spirochaetia bacterium]|nr:hypothetical protein AGMMS50268_16990 [Spirochaetia bacterium]
MTLQGIFKWRKYKALEERLFNYFKFEQTDGHIMALGDLKDKDFSDWLRMIHSIIQKALQTKSFDGAKIENYLVINLFVGGQRVDIALVKDGRKGPHELLEELKAKK